MQVIWSLMHYGWPADLDPFLRPDDFVDAFGTHCRKVAEIVHAVGGTVPLWQPVNEISFLSWAASCTGLIHPHLPSEPENGYRLKCVLVRAALRAMDEIRAVQPDARFVHTDPLVHIEPPRGAGPAACATAAAAHEHQFQAWDMLAGRHAPELGGAARYLDVLGINYYHNNQWEDGSDIRLDWHLNDPRRRRFVDLAEAVWTRYRRPVFIAETGHVGEGRDAWLDHMVEEVLACRARHVPIAGLCLYPVIDRPDWQTADHWHHSGLWDVPAADTGDFSRQLCVPYAERLRHWQRVVDQVCFPTTSSKRTHDMTHLIVFSHLRWDFVYQRPQHLLSRLAATRPVVFVEEPIPGAAEARVEAYRPCGGVTVLRMHVTSHGAGFHDAHMAAMRDMLQTWLTAHDVEEYVVWFYTPMALPLAERLEPRGLVYDCMDELAAFDFAPPELIARENALFDTVDLVFTGGRSLYESKRDRHEDVHCFPSSVDHSHFGQAGLADHVDQAALPQPRLGYYGVIDERLDLDLVAALADAHAEWQIVMVGPVAKIAPESLPRRPNLHWMGQRRYDELPSFLAGWNICLMPFALNASTRFISPTKTLEYLAAGKPVVSTAVRDVALQYAKVVPIATDAATFVAACEAILARSPDEVARFRQDAVDAVSATSWDRTAGAMQTLLKRFDERIIQVETDPVALSVPARAVGTVPAAVA
ncbi:glycosyltransferase [Xylophilus ampelinus]|uniref:glycosyltransferase n=1 Tax=Xylophilus ampelinus TaxID=54067 RepID=UPI001313E961|nr:glycosyltransferase [Xylophilus ampelinus]MCS4509226.1 glycosyltransferase [Xylophilus ampelinus]